MARCGRTNLAGGGGVSSDDVTILKKDVPKNLIAVTADSDDEPVQGELETTATANKVLNSATFYNTNTNTKETGTIASMAAQTVTPVASAQTVSCSGKYMTGDITVSAVSNLTAVNIANGKVVGEVTGTYKGLGNATAAQVLAGKTFSTASLSNTAGTMTNYSGYTSTSNYTSGTFKSGTTGYIFVVPGGTGYYSNATYLRIPATNLAADNIKKGVTILGIKGTFQGMVDSPYYLLQSNTTSNNRPKVQGGFRYSPKQQYVSNSSKISTDWDYNYMYMYIQATNGNNGSSAYVIWSLSDSAISLASYKTLYVNVTVTDANKNTLVAPILGLSTSGSVTSNNFNSSLTFSSEIEEATYSLNISSLNSTYWFYLYQAVQQTGSRGSSGSRITFFKIYLVA